MASPGRKSGLSLDAPAAWSYAKVTRQLVTSSAPHSVRVSWAITRPGEARRVPGKSHGQARTRIDQQTKEIDPLACLK